MAFDESFFACFGFVEEDTMTSFIGDVVIATNYCMNFVFAFTFSIEVVEPSIAREGAADADVDACFSQLVPYFGGVVCKVDTFLIHNRLFLSTSCGVYDNCHCTCGEYV